MIHQHCPLLIIQLPIHPGIPYQINNPLFPLLHLQPQPLAQIPNIDPLVNRGIRSLLAVQRAQDL